MIYRHLKIALLATFIAGAASLTQAEEANPAKQKLDELLSGMTTMTSDVRQLIVESDGGVLEESIIRMKMKRPEGFYWETVEPFPELLVTDGRLLWNYQPDLQVPVYLFPPHHQQLI